MNSDPPQKSRNSFGDKHWIYSHSNITINIPEPLLFAILVLLRIGFLSYCVIVCYNALTQRPFDFITTGSTIICFFWLIVGQNWFRLLSTYKQTLLLGISVGVVVAIGWVIDTLFYHNFLTSDRTTIILFPLVGLIVLTLILLFSHRENNTRHVRKNESREE